MVHKTNAVVGVLNVLTLLLGLAAVGGSIYIIIRGAHASDCQRFFRNPLLIGGALLVIVSTLGIVGSLGRVNVVMSIFLTVTFLLILLLICWTVFALFGIHTQLGQRIWKHYKVSDFQHWLQRYVIDDYQHWKEIKSCLIDSRVCRNLAVDGDQNNEYLIFRHLSITQSGCCKPPVYCGFTMKNVTFWVEPKTGPVESDSDSEAPHKLTLRQVARRRVSIGGPFVLCDRRFVRAIGRVNIGDTQYTSASTFEDMIFSLKLLKDSKSSQNDSHVPTFFKSRSHHSQAALLHSWKACWRRQTRRSVVQTAASDLG
ncbi:hypothetical protein K1719_011831 [Acacia pycnantha]|nr:hypothetical protein K1719_011831 [Acacia pycnantha]